MERRGSATQFFFLVNRRPDRCKRHRTWSDPAAGRHSPGLHLVEPGNLALSSRLVCSAAGRDSPCEASLVRPHRLRAGQVPRSALSVAPVVPRGGAVSHGRYPRPTRSQSSVRPIPRSTARRRHRQQGLRPGIDRALRRTRVHEKRRPPTCRGGGEVGVPARTAYDRWSSSRSAVRDRVKQGQQVTTPGCTGVAELTGVELDGTPESTSAGIGGLGDLPRRQAPPSGDGRINLRGEAGRLDTDHVRIRTDAMT
jgi:hypothetical protein